jgi:Flp pilus assembly protein TadG
VTFLQWYMSTILPAAGALDCLIALGCCGYVVIRLRKHRFNLRWPFGRDERGAVAVEFAIVFPVMLACCMGTLVTWQAMQQRSTAAYVAQACAAIGRGILNQQNNGGLPAVQAAAQQVFSANAGLWLFNASPQLASVTLDGNGDVVCTVTATSSPIVPVPGISQLSASVTAAD